MTPIPGAHITTLQSPVKYTEAQLEQVCRIAHALNRGNFVLCEQPRR